MYIIYMYIYIHLYLHFVKCNISLLYSLRNFVKLKSTKFYENYKSLLNYQKNSNIKDKIKPNMHFDNTFKLSEQKR